MTQQEHKEHIERHQELHKVFDELLADFIQHAEGRLSCTIEQLMRWSYEQTREPDHDQV